MAYDVSEQNFAGEAVVGKTRYRVYHLPVGENSQRAGVVARFALVGPRGSSYFVTDHGQNYRLNSVCMGGGVSWRAQPRPLRGLTRDHLSAFYSEAR